MMKTLAVSGKPIQDIEDYCKTLPNDYIWKDFTIKEDDYKQIRIMLGDMEQAIEANPESKTIIRDLQRKHHYTVKPSYFTSVYQQEVTKGAMEPNVAIEQLLVTSRCRGISGVTVITVFLSPYPNGQQFTCKWNCSYCPNEPGQPRSYLFGEPGVLRANQNGFDCVKQMYARIHTYKVNGHPPDKLEVLILGGTIHSYPKDYLELFMRDIFYGANTCSDSAPIRQAVSLYSEKRVNTQSKHRIIGITVETRPDCITAQELQDFRRWGITRVQLGVQHTDDAILRGVNRGHGLKHTINALTMLKDSCFKVDIHIMPNLPGTTPEKDKAMMDVVLNELHPDQVKVYPCETTPFTKILEDYKEGRYTPYSEKDLEDVVIYWKSRVHPWIRNNRIVRDIPDQYIVAGMRTSSMRNDYQGRMKELGLTCRCIRCREAGRHPKANPADGVLRIRRYVAQGANEYFIAWESVDASVLFGFLRLRLPNKIVGNSVFPELTGLALIRELHVYGRTIAVGAEPTAAANVTPSQHFGIGGTLLDAAEQIALDTGYYSIAVISGVGVRSYYERHGYSPLAGSGEFWVKSFEWDVTLFTAVMMYLVAWSFMVVFG